MKMSEMYVKMSLLSLSKDQGQWMVRNSPCCMLSVCHFWWVVVFDRWSKRKCTRDLRRVFRVRELLENLREALLSRINPILWHTLLPLLLLALRRWLYQPSSDFRDVSNSAEFRSFLLTMYMLAPESTTNSLSSGFIVGGAGKLHSLVGEKKVVLCVSLS